MVHDSADFAIPFTTDDGWIEAGLDDPAYGDPETWPEWTDERWEPIHADRVWLNEQPGLPPAIAGGSPEPTDADWDDMYAASYGFGDDDIQAAGLAVG